ncbi:hypothetical protein DOTSEDRAFT_37459 [Dothistroma septosporum NZE10]|uniref:Uncharacterized protein n=1 Tax=Dothistroma septosporum (strain NZE10 / CBS 128990) TaxID=675120 RepID=N1PEB5_DOTSN|nr:hypothetical protein DOTSEDRAFT_37459 [Dothistroma septosporum NZE10]
MTPNPSQAPLPDHDHKYHINPCPDPASRPKRHEGVHIVDGALASTIDGFETLEKRAAHDLSDAKFAMGEVSGQAWESLEAMTDRFGEADGCPFLVVESVP